MSLPGGAQLKGTSTLRDLSEYPREEGALGHKLFSLVAEALPRGRPAPVVFLFSDTAIDRFSYRGLAGHSHRTRQRILAAIAGQGGVECMAVLGALRFTGRGPMNGTWMANVFIEWPDNRWWTAWQPIDPRGGLVGNEPQVRAAMDGSPRPGGLGGWFALSRRARLSLRIHREAVPVH